MPPRKRSRSKLRSSSRPPPKKDRRTVDKPDIVDTLDSPYRDLRDWTKVEGLPWARQSGLAHLVKVKAKDAMTILEFLQITAEDELRDGYGDLVLHNNPWSWLQRFDEAGGDWQKLSVKPHLKG